MAYTKQTWANGPAGGTPTSAERFNHIEDGIEAVETSAQATYAALPAAGVNLRWVTLTGSDSNNGRSWGNAFATIGAALASLGANPGTIFCSPGTHVGPVVFTAAGQHLVGLGGRWGTAISRATAGPVVSWTSKNDCSLEGFTLVPAAGSNALEVTSSSLGRIRDVYFYGGAIGALVTTCYYFDFDHCFWGGQTSDSVKFTGAANANQINGGRIQGTAGFGVNVDSGNKVAIRSVMEHTNAIRFNGYNGSVDYSYFEGGGTAVTVTASAVDTVIGDGNYYSSYATKWSNAGLRTRICDLEPEIVYVQHTSNTVLDGGTEADVAGLTAASVTLPAMTVTVEAYIPLLANSVSGYVDVKLYDGATQLQLNEVAQGNPQATGVYVKWRGAVAAGTHVFKVRVFFNGAGSGTVYAGATDPAFLRVVPS